MATYPYFLISYKSKKPATSKYKKSASLSGKPKVTTTSSRLLYKLTLTHENLITSNKDIIEAFYTANQNIAFDFVWPDFREIMSCKFTKRPQAIQNPAGFWEIKMAFSGYDTGATESGATDIHLPTNY